MSLREYFNRRHEAQAAPLPEDSSYVEGSFEVDECGIDILDENGVIVDE